MSIYTLKNKHTIFCIFILNFSKSQMFPRRKKKFMLKYLKIQPNCSDICVWQLSIHGVFSFFLFLNNWFLCQKNPFFIPGEMSENIHSIKLVASYKSQSRVCTIRRWGHILFHRWSSSSVTCRLQADTPAGMLLPLSKVALLLFNDRRMTSSWIFFSGGKHEKNLSMR